MADRNMSAAMLAQLAAQRNQPIHLFEAHFDDGVVRASDAYRTITWNGNSYAANGHLLNFEGVQESAEIKIAEARVSLSGVDQAWISIVLQKNYIDRRLVIYKAFMDAAALDAVVVDPTPIFEGRMDAPAIEENPADGSSTVLITAANHWIDFERRPGRHTNHEEQQIYYPGDKFFEFVTGINTEVVWGRK